MGIMFIAKRIPTLAYEQLRRSLAIFSPRNPVYIFHHIPKCGGTSLREVLDNWFITIKDYRPGGALPDPEKVDLKTLRSCHCLCSHFEVEGFYLHQRYPEVLKSDRYKIFTCIRDPLQVQLSLFRFERKHGISQANNIEEHLFLRPNYLANRFPASLDNYKEIIDRYFFVVVLEESEASLAILASLLGKRYKQLPWANRTQKAKENDYCGNELPEDLIARFKSENALDYLIYDYCVEKFNRKLAEHGIASNRNSEMIKASA